MLKIKRLSVTIWGTSWALSASAIPIISMILTGLFTSLLSTPLHASQRECEEALLGPRFLHAKFPNLYRSKGVEVAAAKAASNGQRTSQPEQKILAWLNGLDRFRMEKRDNPKAVEQIKKMSTCG